METRHEPAGGSMLWLAEEKILLMNILLLHAYGLKLEKIEKCAILCIFFLITTMSKGAVTHIECHSTSTFGNSQLTCTFHDGFRR